MSGNSKSLSSPSKEDLSNDLGSNSSSPEENLAISDKAKRTNSNPIDGNTLKSKAAFFDSKSQNSQGKAAISPPKVKIKAEGNFIPNATKSGALTFGSSGGRLKPYGISKKITEEDEDFDFPDERLYNDDVNPSRFKNPVFKLPGNLSDCNPTPNSTASQDRKNTQIGNTGTENPPSNNSHDNDDYNEFQYTVINSKRSDGSRYNDHKQFKEVENPNRFNHFRDNITFSSLTPYDAKLVSTSSKTVYDDKKQEHNHIVLVWNDGTVYKGELKNGQFHGNGILEHSEGFQIDGNFVDGKVEGQARFSKGALSYNGKWANSCPEGQGREALEGVYDYEGNFLQGKKCGKGVLKIANKGEYDGNFRDNMFNGEGKFTWLDGKKYEGTWYNNRMHGKGKMVWPDGRKYIGRYSQNNKEGFGRFVWADGREYIGNWSDGKQHGRAWYIDLQGVKTDTEWDRGIRKT